MSSDALSVGKVFSAETAILVRMAVMVRRPPACSAIDLYFWRTDSRLVMSAELVIVTWGTVDQEWTIRSAVILRILDIFSRTTLGLAAGGSRAA